MSVYEKHSYVPMLVKTLVVKFLGYAYLKEPPTMS